MSDEDLPCRGDCHCPANQYCISGTCKATSKPTPASEGTVGGACAAGDVCTDVNATCVEDVCGSMVCRAACDPVLGGCGGGEVCEGISSDAGASRGVCVP